MAKKTARRSNLKRFSIVRLHNQLDTIVTRLGRANTRSANDLRDKVRRLRRDTACPQNMVLDLS